MRNHKYFDGMDLNSKEKAICREKPIQAMQMYRKRTGYGLKDARDAVEQELGIDYSAYGQVKEIVAFSIFYNGNYFLDINEKESENNLQYALRSWRRLKRQNKDLIHKFYETAIKIINLDDIEFEEDDPRNGG